MTRIIIIVLVFVLLLGSAIAGLDVYGNQQVRFQGWEDLSGKVNRIGNYWDAAVGIDSAIALKELAIAEHRRADAEERMAAALERIAQALGLPPK